MFGLSFVEVIVVAVIILIFVGPRQLPEVARTVARFMNEFKRTTAEFTESFYSIRTEVNKSMEESKEQLEKQMGLKKLQEDIDGLDREVAQLDEAINKEPSPAKGADGIKGESES